MKIESINHIPDQPWVYFFKDFRDNILYIWKAKNLKKRVSQYFSLGSVWKQEMLEKADNVEFFIVKNESEALYLEDNLIKKHKPFYNNMLKWSNSYAYIKITKHDFPLIFLTRKKTMDGSIYIWPKHNNAWLKNFLQYLRQLLMYRGCKNVMFAKGKVCSDYYFGLCRWWCVLANSEKLKTKNDIWSLEDGKREYKKIIDLIQDFFKWNISSVQKEIKKQIEDSIQKQNFEWSAKLRDIYVQIQDFTERQTVVLANNFTGYILKIKKIWNRNVYVILNFMEWKIVDVFRHKQSQDDEDFDSLISSFEAEFLTWNEKKTVEKKSEFIVAYYCLKAMKFTNKEKSELDNLIEGFFDSYILSTSFEDENLNNELLQSLQQRYFDGKFPYHMECLDISHLSGGRNSGWLTCFIWWIPEKKYYRRYKIGQEVHQVGSPSGQKSGTWRLYKRSDFQSGWDDYASLEEVISRRFSNEDFLPDVFILDGGKWQLGIIKKILQEKPDFQKYFDKVLFVSLGKWEARNKTSIWKKSSKSENQIWEKIYYFDDKMVIKSKDMVYDQADKILLKLRNESHRFANAYREKQMSKEWK